MSGDILLALMRLAITIMLMWAIVVTAKRLDTICANSPALCVPTQSSMTQQNDVEPDTPNSSRGRLA